MTGRLARTCGLVGCVLVVSAGVGGAQSSPGASTVRVLPVRGSIYVLQGAGGNITASVGRDGVLLVDTGAARAVDQVLAAVRQLQERLDLRDQPIAFGAETRSSVAGRHMEAPPKPIRYLINTHFDPEHVGGNETLRTAGRTFTGGNVAGNIADAGEGAAILAHEQVLARMTTPDPGVAATPIGAQPTDTYYADTMKLSHFFNGEGIQLMHQPAAHSDGDSIVYFRGSDVIATGDIFSTVSYPVIDTSRGGTIDGVIAALNRVLDLSVPEFRTEGGTLIVPGDGRLSDAADVAYYRDMVTILRDRIKAMVDREMTLEEVKAARPTADYEPRYGAGGGAWTTDQFIEAAYVSLGGGKRTAEQGAGRARRRGGR